MARAVRCFGCCALLDRERFTPIVVLPEDGPLSELIRAMQIEVIIRPPLSVIDRAVFHSFKLPFFLPNIPCSVFGFGGLSSGGKSRLFTQTPA